MVVLIEFLPDINPEHFLYIFAWYLMTEESDLECPSTVRDFTVAHHLRIK